MKAKVTCDDGRRNYDNVKSITQNENYIIIERLNNKLSITYLKSKVIDIYLEVDLD